MKKQGNRFYTSFMPVGHFRPWVGPKGGMLARERGAGIGEQGAGI